MIDGLLALEHPSMLVRYNEFTRGADLAENRKMYFDFTVMHRNCRRFTPYVDGKLNTLQSFRGAAEQSSDKS